MTKPPENKKTTSAISSAPGGEEAEKSLDFTASLKRKAETALASGPDSSIYSLLYATTRLMEEKNYNKLRVEEIVKVANVSRATFYNHFDSKLLVCCGVFDAYSRFTYSKFPRPAPSLHPFDELFQINLFYTHLLLENAKVHFRFVELSSYIPEVAELWDRYVFDLNRGMPRRLYSTGDNMTELDKLADIWLAGSLLHENVYALYIAKRTPAARTFIHSPEHLAYRASLIIYRARFMEVPPASC
ncbi:MAG: helix-turn-helix domain-containing protein, partial [Pseudomonadota bacterium]